MADGSEFLIINISDPTNPNETGSLGGGASGVFINNHYAYVAAGEGMRIIDVLDPNNPSEITFKNLNWSVKEIIVSGNYAYVANDYYGLAIYDISNLGNPTRVGTFEANTYVMGVAVSGNYAFVANRDVGLRVADISDPTNPSRFGRFPTDIIVSGVAISGDYAYVMDGSFGVFFRIFNISNPAKPIQTGILFGDGGFKTAVRENYAYVAGGSGFVIIDISDPTNPTEISSLTIYAIPVDVALSGDYVYTAELYFDIGGLRIIDVSDPTNPTETGLFNSGINSVAVSGNYAYITNNSLGLRIIDVSNPSNPIQIGFFDTNGEARDATVSGNYAYVADWKEGLRIIDVSNPNNPSEIGFFDTDGNAESVTVDGDYAYVADGYNGLQIIDISDPTNPTKRGFFDADGDVSLYYAQEVAASGEYIFIGYGEYGLCIVRNDLLVGLEDKSHQIVRNFKLEQNFPNPFNPTTTISYNLPHTSNVVLEIYNLLGQKVRTLMSTKQIAGKKTVVWDARDRFGKAVSSGIYIYRIETGSYSASRKMLLLR